MVTSEPEAGPVLRVVRGAPDEVELAALTVVLNAIASGGDRAPTTQRHRSPWSDPHALQRRPIGHGPWAWHASGLPG